MNFASDPTYLEELNSSSESFEKRYYAYWTIEGPRVGSMSSLARQTASRVELGRARVGLITLMAQTMPQTPLAGPHGRSTRRAQFEISSDIVAIAATIASSRSDELQIGRTQWKLGELAYDAYLPDLSTAFLTKAAQTYVRLRRWPEVAVLYSNLGISEAGAGYAGSAIGWFNLSAEVSCSLNDEPRARLTTSIADAVKREPSRFFAPSLQLKELLSSRVLTSSTGAVVEIYGVGVVAMSAVVPSMIAGLQLMDSVGDSLLHFVDQAWPNAAIAATAVDVRTIKRILTQPELLDSLEPRAFEVLVATLYEGFGAEVELTKETRDGGYDVGATFEVGDARFRVLIEAKKWHQERKVGIATVDRLIGVKQRMKADKVMLVTTSTFSTVARKAAAQIRSEIELVDRGGLAEWVKQYLLPAPAGAVHLPSLQLGVDKDCAEEKSADAPQKRV